jgi:RNA polymerase sigma-70 factor (ECF subfamily)
MASLPAEQRTAVQLAYFEGYTYREVAEITGVPSGTAHGRMRLALGKLREALAGSAAAPLPADVRLEEEMSR